MDHRYESTRREDLGLGSRSRTNRTRGWHDSVHNQIEETNPILVMVSLVFVVAAMLYVVDQFLPGS